MNEKLTAKNATHEKKSYDYQTARNKGTSHPIDKFLKINKFFYRPVTSPLVRLIFKTPITPNELTVMAFIAGVSGSALFLMGIPFYFIIGALLIQLSQFLDIADGMLARSKGLRSDFGGYLDLFLDRVTDFCILTGIALGHYRFSGNIGLFHISIFAIGLYFLQVSLYYVTNHYLGKTKTGESEEARALLLLSVLVFSILNRLDILIYIVFSSAVINVVYRLFCLFYLRKKATLRATTGSEADAGTNAEPHPESNQLLDTNSRLGNGKAGSRTTETVVNVNENIDTRADVIPGVHS